MERSKKETSVREEGVFVKNRKKPVMTYSISKSLLNFWTALLGLLIAAPTAIAGDFEKGTGLYNARDYSGAAQAFQRVVKGSPTNWQAHYYLGHVNMATEILLPLVKHMRPA